MEGARTQFDAIRQILEAQRTQILREAGRVVESGINSSAELFPDPTDMATREELEAFSLRLKEREKNLLRKIDMALDRIEEGSFGICEACGQPIEERRLMARPVTTLCIACKTDQENREKMEQSTKRT
ncbi:TraR/DksA family transcriptional regulator [Leptospirillum ferriphilum]|uniref:Conjugal transfer protein TraR n=1 Tax=Leptospirillum ferriphilum YSK TaxID=1441628 RepID=A0A059XN07_9BACT|nr:TraR/DksA C4-type zinc finger protein [Leptospirillum ferriphilum]AIA29924.1 conjugal transfer protein TraR [Leptospirillum ferriphilum YSK]